MLNSLSLKASCTVQVLLQLLGVISIPWDRKPKSERPEGIPTERKIKRTNKNESQEEKSLLKDILGSKTVCPLLCFVALYRKHSTSWQSHNATEKGFSTLQGNLCVSAVHTPSNLVTGNVKAHFIEN